MLLDERRMPGRFLVPLALLIATLSSPLDVTAQSSPDSYYAVTNRNVYPKPPVPSVGPAGSRFVDRTFGSRLMRVTDANTRPGFPGRSYSTPSAAHQLAWNSTSTRFYIRSLDGWFIPYNFDPIAMTASRIQPTPTGDGGLLISSQVVEPQFSFMSPDIIFAAKPDPTATDGINYPVVHKYDFSTGQYSDVLNLRPYTTVDPCPPQEQPWCWDTYAGALSSSATAPERISVMFNGRGQDWHYKLAVFEAAAPQSTLIILNTLASQLTIGGGTPQPTPTLGFRLHHAWIDQTGRWVMLYPVNAQPSPMVVWDLTTHTFTHVATRPFGHDALGFGWQVNQDCCTSGLPFDGAQWQLRSLNAPQTTFDLISPPLSPQQPCIADHTSWNNAAANRRVPVLSSLYRYAASGCPASPPWRAWDDEVVAIRTDLSGGSRVWRFAHHRSNVGKDNGQDGTYFWYQPHANISPDGRWALFTSNWEKTLGTATNSEPEGIYRTDVFVVRLLSGSFLDAPLSTGALVRAVHFTELRARIDVLRVSYGLTPYDWTDPTLLAGMTVKAAHLTDLRTALLQAYDAASRPPPTFSEGVTPGVTLIRVLHIEELRVAVIDLEGG
jgi:hypothetical protein